MSETKTDRETSRGEDLHDSLPADYSSSTPSRRPDDDSAEELQRKYLHMIKTGKVSSVRTLLDRNSGRGFDVNCKNYRGTTGLNLAIEVNCEQMIDLLLSQPELEIGDSLMHAIRHNRYATVIKLLDVIRAKSPETVELGSGNSTEFPQYLTPIMLAAQCGHYRIISLLLARGHAIQTPHRAGCLCKKVSTRVYMMRCYCLCINRSYFIMSLQQRVFHHRRLIRATTKHRDRLQNSYFFEKKHKYLSLSPE